MKLSNLIKSIKPISINGIKNICSDAFAGSNKFFEPDIEINSIHYRAQDVKPDGLFVAVQGISADGHDFIDEAVARGATAIITQKPFKKESVIIEVKNSRKALSLISSQFFGNPSGKLFIIGITGTNAKTTNTYLIESILLKAGFKVGVIGSINYRYCGMSFNNPMTTPESYDLQKILAEMLQAGITHVVMEVSSHAIDLFRIENCWLDVGLFTNFSQDHLDYHKDMDSYWSCKKRFFTDYLNCGYSRKQSKIIINCNNAKGKELLNSLLKNGQKNFILSTGYTDENMVYLQKFKYSFSGTTGRISTPSGSFDFESSLVGKHNIENILCAAGAGIALNLSTDIIKEGIKKVSSVPGRLEPVANDTGRFIYVDYAHTPGALETVLSSLRSLTTGRIICVFGCGGNRDRDKRPMMGEIAARLSDLSIITSDNPRTEDPIKIIGHILAGVKKISSCEYTESELKTGFSKKGYIVEPERKSAILMGIAASQKGDAVLIAGKGHESYQIIGENSIPFDDRKEAKIALSFENRKS